MAQVQSQIHLMKIKPEISEVAGTYHSGMMYRNDNIAWTSTLTVESLPAQKTFQLRIHTKCFHENGDLKSEIDELDAKAHAFAYFPHWQAYVLRLQGHSGELLHVRIPHRIFSRQFLASFESDVEFYRNTFADQTDGQTEIML